MYVFYRVSEDILKNYTLDACEQLVFVNVFEKVSKGLLNCIGS
jgi:hypothetical protein